jgi:queuine tRNA-ribosyltransferase
VSAAGAFKVLAQAGRARAGVLETAHGVVETPVFMPVGTQATVKALSSGDVERLGARIILGNHLSPGAAAGSRARGDVSAACTNS